MPEDVTPKLYAKGATAKAAVLDYCLSRWQDTGRLPTTAAIARHMGFNSRTHARYYLNLLRTDGILANPNWGVWIPGPIGKLYVFLPDTSS